MLTYFCAVPVPSDKMRMRPETCIIRNQYHPLMVSVLPLAAHNGPFLRFSASCSAFWWWQNGDSGVTWEETRWTMGPFIYLSRTGIASTWHGVHVCACSRNGRQNKRWKNALHKEKVLILTFIVKNKQRIKGQYEFHKEFLIMKDP